MDWPLLAELIKTVVLNPESVKLPENIEPAPYFQHVPQDAAMREKYRQAQAIGENLLKKIRLQLLWSPVDKGRVWDGTARKELSLPQLKKQAAVSMLC